jgi:hypothetical protein
VTVVEFAGRGLHELKDHVLWKESLARQVVSTSGGPATRKWPAGPSPSLFIQPTTSFSFTPAVHFILSLSVFDAGFLLNFAILTTKQQQRRCTMNPLKAVARLVLVTLFIVAVSAAGESPKDAKGTRFFVRVSHTPEECLKTLDEVSAKSKELLAKFDWGCMAGDHTGYAILEGKDEMAVKQMLPADMQNAKIQKLNKFTAEQIKSFHEKH